PTRRSSDLPNLSSSPISQAGLTPRPLTGYAVKLQAGLGFFNQSRKRCFFIHGQVSQYFTVNFNHGFFQAIDELAVRQTVQTCAGVDTRDPQLTELTLTLTTVAVSILTGFNNGLLGNTEYTAASTVVTFSLLQNFFVTTTSDHTTFYTSHSLSPEQ